MQNNETIDKTKQLGSLHIHCQLIKDMDLLYTTPHIKYIPSRFSLAVLK